MLCLTHEGLTTDSNFCREIWNTTSTRPVSTGLRSSRVKRILNTVKWVLGHGRKGRQSNKVWQLNNLSIFIFDSSDWHCLIFFRIMDERATRMGERARLMAVNQDMRCDWIFFRGVGMNKKLVFRCILNWSWTLSAFVVALRKKCVAYAETFQPFWPTLFAAVLWFLLHWFLCCGAFLTAIPLSSPLEAWTRMRAQN